MRPDMKKVVVERPRLYRYKELKHFREDQTVKNDLEAAPTKEPLRSRRQRTKQFNEHLRPLYRYLKKQVGRPWDKIYSEVLKGLGGGQGTLQDHVLTHVNSYVEQNVTMVDGIPHKISSWGGLRPIANDAYRPLFVHPRTGLLCVSKPPKKKQERFEVHRLSQFQAILFWRNTWYLAKLKKFPDPKYDFVKRIYIPASAHDAWLEKKVYIEEAKRLWGNWGTLVERTHYAESLRMMSKSEVKALPLTLNV